MTKARWGWSIGACALAMALVWPALDRRLTCAALFLRLEASSGPAWLVHYREHALTVRDYTFAGGRGRLYTPVGVSERGLVLAHGMHEEGIREPRLVALARALAGAGYTVLTPEVPGLASYQLRHTDVDTIAAAAVALAGELRQPQVAVLGISFGGGLALRAACEPKKRDAISRVLALGAHHDASRVSRFYLGQPALDPRGQPALVEPHPYGLVALWTSLHGHKHEGALSSAERQELADGVEAHQSELQLASPASCTEAVRVPLYLLHGSGDRVVPYTETLWNERQFAGQTHVETLISAAIAHAEYTPPSWSARLRLIEFMVAALD